jgi:hypothetical protein
MAMLLTLVSNNYTLLEAVVRLIFVLSKGYACQRVAMYREMTRVDFYDKSDELNRYKLSAVGVDCSSQWRSPCISS